MEEPTLKAVPAPAPAAETTKPTVDRTRNMPSLTGLRFYAAMAVVLCHVGINVLPRLTDSRPVIGTFHAIGIAALSFFFVLSGFVLTWVTTKKVPVQRFWRRRFFRVYPNHLVTFAVLCVLAAIAGHALSARDTVATLFLVHAWIPDQHLLYNLWSNAPTWSLGLDLLFYLLFPILLPLVQKIRPERLWLAFIATYALIWSVPFVATLLPASEIQQGTGVPWLQMWFMTFFPPVRMLEFILGMVLAQILIHGKWIRFPLPVALVLPILAVFAQGVLPLRFGVAVLQAVPMALVIGAVATADLGSRATAFGGRKMVFLGEISYAIYLIHWLVVAYGPIGRTSPGWGGDPSGTSSWPWVIALSVVTIAVSIGLAVLLHLFVERPAMNRWSRSSRPPQSVPVSTAPQ